MDEYLIEFDMYTTQEIIKIIGFFQLIEQTKTKKINKQLLIDQYKEYRNIINNKALEKKYDKMLYDKSKVSI
jgi:uncharacterized protein YktA (UPF0223 family)